MTAASLRRGCRPDVVEGLPEFVDPMGSPIAQFSDDEHYCMTDSGRATRASIAPPAKSLGRESRGSIEKKGDPHTMVTEPSMAPQVSLRPSHPSDYQFALDLYLGSTKRLLLDLGRWDESRVIARFKEGFKPKKAQVILSDAADIGWIQTSNSSDEFHLDQLRIIDHFFNLRIGTGLIHDLQNRARRTGKTVALNVIRGNSAIVLYRRLGFRIVGEDEERLKLRWEGGGSERG
jgi:ribosomal protein S18 acetylase RimI-like enzyme